MSSYQMKFQFKNVDGSSLFFAKCQFHVCATIRSRLILLFLFAQTLHNFWWALKREIDKFSDKQYKIHQKF